MDILFAAAEAYPFLKTGGLGDVAYALPKALNGISQRVRVIMPLYSTISPQFKNNMIKITDFNVRLNWRNQYCGLFFLNYNGVDFYFIDNEYYFDRPEPYGYFDDGERFAFFCHGILEAIKFMGDFCPKVLHLNDWHTGMVAPLFRHFYENYEPYKGMKIIYTIHNLKYQGVFPKETLYDLLNLPEYYFDEEALKFYDGVSFMKGGINFSDRITTVSKTYAEEIKTPFYGEGLHGLLSKHSYKLRGIVNGVDYDLFDPRVDNKIYKNYDENYLEGKYENKAQLQRELGLEENRDIPIISMVTRLVDQKGIDILLPIMEELLSCNVQFALVGSGQKNYEDTFKTLAYRYKGKVYNYTGYNEALAQKLYAGSDFFLMPSLFEPCGIGQLIALRYGTLPIVRETGGLKDTVSPYNEYSGEGNGFSFTYYNSYDMLFTIKKALSFYNNKEVMGNLIHRAMEEDNSWKNSARLYLNLYEELS